MKSISPSVLRATIALVVGFILIKWPDLAINYIIITVGLLFLIPGIIGFVLYFIDKGKNAGVAMPLESVGSMLFGLCLAIVPAFFANIVTVLLGVVLLLGGLQQVSSLVVARKWSNVSFGFYIVPVLILLSGVYVLLNPSEARATTLLIIGITSLIYGLFELLKWFKFTRHKPMRGEVTDFIETKRKDSEK